MNFFGEVDSGFLQISGMVKMEIFQRLGLLSRVSLDGISRMDDTFDILVQRAHDLLRTIELTILLTGCFTTPVQGEHIITEAMLILKAIGSIFDPKFTRTSFILHHNLENFGFEMMSWNRRTLTIL